MMHEGAARFSGQYTESKSGDRFIDTSESVIKEVIPEIVEPTYALMRELAPHLDAGEYAVIWREGKSATIPFYVTSRAIAEIYHAKGLPSPKYERRELFFSLSTEEQKKAVTDAQEAIKAHPTGSRALVVTEYLAEGGHLRNYAALAEHGIPYDIATVFARGERQDYESNPKIVPSRARLFVGRDRNATPLLSRRHELFGQQYKSHSPYPLRYMGDVPSRWYGGKSLREVIQGTWEQVRSLKDGVVAAHLERSEEASVIR